jgi:hypothetical protein
MDDALQSLNFLPNRCSIKWRSKPCQFHGGMGHDLIHLFILLTLRTVFCIIPWNNHFSSFHL